jgi:hypothetical protein
MNIISGIRVPVLLVMMASMVVSSGCTAIVEYLVCGEHAYWNSKKFRCEEPDPEQLKANLEKYIRESGICKEEGGEWIHSTDTCSFGAKNNKAMGHKCEEEGGEWVLWSLTCSYAARDKKEAKAAKSHGREKSEK